MQEKNWVEEQASSSSSSNNNDTEERHEASTSENETLHVIQSHIPQNVLAKMEVIYKQINEFSQNAVVCLKEIFEHVNRIPKPTLTLITLIVLLSSYIVSMIINAFYFQATDLVCKVTPYSHSIFSFCKSTIPNFTAIVEAQVEVQERLLKQSAELDSEGSLAHDIKKVELATKDLMLAVKFSNLEFKTLLSQKLKEFAEASFEANSDLQTLQVRAQTSLDNTLTYISYTLKAIEDYEGKVISPRMERDLNKLHDTMMKLTEEDLRKLILATDRSLKILKKLDAMQSTIHEITAQEERLQNLDYEELLSNLWTILGGNRVERSIFENNLKLLTNLDSKRKVAVERIALIIEYLNKFQKQLNVLREETVTRFMVDIPVGVHLTNIKKALMRLQMNEITAGVKIEKISESGQNKNPKVIML